jgi:hypothetical protein
MSNIIPSDEDGVIQEQETPNEYEQVPVLDEPDEDEDEFKDEEQEEEPW